MRTLNDYFISGRISDISTAGSTFVAVPDGGRIIKIMSVLQGAISGGNAAITFEIGGVAVTNDWIYSCSFRFCGRYNGWFCTNSIK